MNSETRAAIEAAVDAGDIGAFLADLPDGTAGQVLLAARACKRMRTSAVDAIALACEGRSGEAGQAANDATAHMGTMLRRLTAAGNLTASQQMTGVQIGDGNSQTNVF